jgi:hypothetical protein
MPETAPYPSWARLRAVAAAQRRVLLLFLAMLVLYPFAISVLSLTKQGTASGDSTTILTAVLGGAFLVLAVSLLVGMYRLARALGARVPALWALGSWFSCLGFVLILILNGRATRMLKRSGVKVGFLGVKDLPATPPPGVLTSDVADVFS